MNGREKERVELFRGCRRPFRDEKGHELGLGADVLDQLEDGLAGGRVGLGHNHVDLLRGHQAVPEEPDPIALTETSPGKDFRNLVIKAEPMADL